MFNIPTSSKGRSHVALTSEEEDDIRSLGTNRTASPRKDRAERRAETKFSTEIISLLESLSEAVHGLASSQKDLAKETRERFDRIERQSAERSSRRSRSFSSHQSLTSLVSILSYKNSARRLDDHDIVEQNLKTSQQALKAGRAERLNRYGLGEQPLSFTAQSTSQQ